jgi:hypothetical protein
MVGRVCIHARPVTVVNAAGAILPRALGLALCALALAGGEARGADAAGARAAILQTFGPRYGEQAIAVAGCETGGTFSVWAGYGSAHTGLFQMGRREREIYAAGAGHWWGWWAQTRAAREYFVATGRTWRPWTCKPKG